MTERKKILLIGSCGFLLSNFLRKNIFQKDNNYYIGIDKLSESHSFYNKYIHKNYKFYVGDITDIGFLENIFKLERPEIIIFGAGSSNDIVSAQTKLIGLNNIIQLEYTYPIIDKLIYLSSDKIYHPNASEELDECSQITPTTFNSSIEWMIENLIQESRIQYIILRLSNVIGQRQNLNTFTAKAISALLSNKKFFIPQNGLRKFDWLNIDDFCSALNLSLQTINKVYNISSGILISELEVANEICDQLKSNKDLISFIEDKKYNFIHVYKTSSKRLQEDCNWKPNSNWKEAIEQMCQWAIANKWYYLRD